MKLTEHANKGQVGSGIVDNAFGAMLDEEFKKLQCLTQLLIHDFPIKVRLRDRRCLPDLVYLPPLLSCLLCESFVNHRHNFVEEMTVHNELINNRI